MKNKKRASIFMYVVFLTTITSILGVLIINNTFNVSNNIEYSQNQYSLLEELNKKAEVSLNNVVRYNSNGDGFSNIGSCPKGITMSGTLNSETGIESNLVSSSGSIYCSADYNGDELRIFFNESKTGFSYANYKGESVKILKLNGDSVGISGTNIGPTSTVLGSEGYATAPRADLIDGDKNPAPLDRYDYVTRHTSFPIETLLFSGRDSCDSVNPDPYIEIEFNDLESLGRVDIYNNGYNSSWEGAIEGATVSTIDIFDNVIDSIQLGSYTSNPMSVDFKYSGLLSPAKKIRITPVDPDYCIMLMEVEVFPVEVSGAGNMWVGVPYFSDSDDTLLTFSVAGTFGTDGIDDNLDSDDYRVYSTGTIEYFGGYQDDDVYPKKTIFGGVFGNEVDKNIFWSNSKTNKVIDDNTNNSDSINQKIGVTEDGLLKLKVSSKGTLDYDLKVVELDRNEYDNYNSLLPTNIYRGFNLTSNEGNVNLNSGNLYLSGVTTGDELIFNFRDNDYGVFISNNSSDDLSYRIEGFDNSSGSGLYINPINDSLSGSISILANHILVGSGANLIGSTLVSYTKKPDTVTQYTGSGAQSSTGTRMPGCNRDDFVVGPYRVAACNLGSFTFGTSEESYGSFFQWGNNYQFSHTGSLTTSSSTVDTSSYGPSNYYDDGTYITTSGAPNDWSSPRNDNLWGGDDDSEISRRGACPEGYHIPTIQEMNAILDMGGWGENGAVMVSDLQIPYGGYFDNDSSHQDAGSAAILLTASTTGNDFYNFDIRSGNISEYNVFSRSRAGNIRCIRNTTTYPGCDEQDIIIGNHILSACNVGTNISGTGATSFGNKFQWGNNYPFPDAGTTNIFPIQNDASGFGPSNYYYDSTFIIRVLFSLDWSSSQNDNLWGDTDNSNSARRGACAEGYHIPTESEWNSVITEGGWASDGEDMSNQLLLPVNGWLNRLSGASGDNADGYYFTSSPSGTEDAYHLHLDLDGANNDALVSTDSRSYGMYLRCFKNQ